MRNQREILHNLVITQAAAEGKSLARAENMVVFVSGAVPGDVADVEIFKKKKNYAEGRAVNIIEPSPMRIQATCRHFGICGGCKWQNLKYKAQLSFKQQQVEDNLKHIGGLSNIDIRPVIGSERQFGYRNKLEFTFCDKKWVPTGEFQALDGAPAQNALGFHLPRFFDKVLDIENCLLMEQTADKIRNKLREYCIKETISFYNPRTHQGMMRNLIVRNSVSGQWMAIVVFARFEKEIIDKMMDFLEESFPEINSLIYIVNEKKNDTITDQVAICRKGEPWITEEFDGLSFRIGPLSFFQTNPRQAIVMYRQIAALASPEPHQLIYDLYTGTGSIACYLAAKARHVVGIEYVHPAIEDAKINATLNGIGNTTFVCGDIAKTLNEDFFAMHGNPDIVVTDPPRSGMHPDVVDQIIRIRPRKVVYVSCNPATQARDLALLKDNFRITAIQPIDMFPHTHHVENIALLESD